MGPDGKSLQKWFDASLVGQEASGPSSVRTGRRMPVEVAQRCLHRHCGPGLTPSGAHEVRHLAVCVLVQAKLAIGTANVARRGCTIKTPAGLQAAIRFGSLLSSATTSGKL